MNEIKTIKMKKYFNILLFICFIFLFSFLCIKILQNILNLFIELITPTYYEEDKINDNISKWSFGIHELFSDYDPLPLYPEENNIIKV